MVVPPKSREEGNFNLNRHTNGSAVVVSLLSPEAEVSRGNEHLPILCKYQFSILHQSVEHEIRGGPQNDDDWCKPKRSKEWPSLSTKPLTHTYSGVDA
ncbi:hypothetical protein ACH5RR_019439 [Cinchona calisaya]|uniref:Uncharacterized protein n=1 Tax=Cinchona calisaya TaxID=153742 RepID=A0ABD2ZSG4_9GENT